MAQDESETVSLIGSDKVEGTAVFGPDGDRIGSIQRVMIEKVSGRVSYAVLSFGGFLGIGDDNYPLPWPSLKYNVELGGYQTAITRQQLDAAPRYGLGSEWDLQGPGGTRAVDSYYGMPVI